MTTLETPIAELENVCVEYGTERVLDTVSLRIARGDFLGIIGPNGSGKTTLLRVLLGLLHPRSGQVRLFGTEIGAFREWHRIGYVPQRLAIDAALPATVEEVIATGLVASLGSFRRRSVQASQGIDEVLARVGMDAHRRIKIGALSVGQQQRVLIARALVSRPELLVLDEPTSGVDPEAQTSFYGLLHHLNREHDVTLILVSHDIGAVAKQITKLACLNRRLVFHGPPADFLKDETALSALYGPSMRIVIHEHP